MPGAAHPEGELSSVIHGCCATIGSRNTSLIGAPDPIHVVAQPGQLGSGDGNRGNPLQLAGWFDKLEGLIDRRFDVRIATSNLQPSQRREGRHPRDSRLLGLVEYPEGITASALVHRPHSKPNRAPLSAVM